MSLPAPSNPKSILCKLGLHKDIVLEGDGPEAMPVPTYGQRQLKMMVMYNLYTDYCVRCGRRRVFEFWIDRS